MRSTIPAFSGGHPGDEGSVVPLGLSLARDRAFSAGTPPWLRGITLARLAAFIAVCAALAARPALWNFNPERALWALGRWQYITFEYFACGLPLFVLIVKSDIWTSRLARNTRIAWLAAAVLGGALLFVLLYAARFSVSWGRLPHWQAWIAFFVRAALTGGLFAAVLHFSRKERDAERRLHEARLACVGIERQTAESRLTLLQAQIEPHFLFNSLASVKRLYERQPGVARGLLRNLVDYIRQASSHARRLETRLGDEIALARAFFSIFQVRMGTRLQVRIDMPAGLEGALLPPLMVGTLVENAIKHGLAPRGEGGTVTIQACIEGAQLEIRVADDGVGFQARSGTGVGLANIRARLAAMYAGDAELEVNANPGPGITAVLRIPYRTLPRTGA